MTRPEAVKAWRRPRRDRPDWSWKDEGKRTADEQTTRRLRTLSKNLQDVHREWRALMDQTP